jgi:sugar lactone lactonase YvrE
MKHSDWRIAAQTRDRLGESALWHPREKAIYWVDCYGPTLHRLREGGKVESWTISDAKNLGSIVFVKGGRLMLSLDTGLVLFDPKTGARAAFADPNGGRPDIAYNDSKIDRFGRLWAGTFDLAEVEPRGIFYCVEPDGHSFVADSGFPVCNGPAFSPDGRTLYFSDSVGRRILAYDMAGDTPVLRDRRVFATTSEEEGLPDGLTVDAAGDVWCAQYAGARVTRYTPDGRIREVYPLPCPTVTSCSLGGANMSTLYVTTGWSLATTKAEDEPGPGGALFALEVDAKGLPEPELDIA